MKNLTSFKKGHVPSEISRLKMSLAKKGKRMSPTTEFKKGSMISWKGDNAGYVAKHIWVSKQRGRPHYCEHCKRSDLNHHQYHWANISGKYKRDVSDYIRLCAKCHRKMDFPNEKHK